MKAVDFLKILKKEQLGEKQLFHCDYIARRCFSTDLTFNCPKTRKKGGERKDPGHKSSVKSLRHRFSAMNSTEVSEAAPCYSKLGLSV